MKKRVLALMLVAAMCASLAACGGGSAAKETTAPETQAAASEAGETEAAGDPVKGGTLTISLSASPSKLDPIHYSGTYESQIIKEVCDTLIEYNSDLSEYVPCLATEWTASEDGKTYVFKIREGVKFHKGQYQDGRELTAEDVAYSLNRSGQLSDSNRLSMLENAEVTGDYEVTCTLKSANSSFLTALTDAGNAIVPQEEVDGWGDEFGNHLVGTGPFILESFQLDQQAVLQKNADYWMAEPNVDTLIFKIITDSTQAVNALQTGEVDIAMDLKGESVQTVRDNADLTLLETAGLHVAYIYFNMEQGPTADINVRKALIEAVNTEEMVAALYKYGEAQKASLPLPPGSWGYDASLESKVPGYDPEDAKKLLEEAGYGDGLTLDLYISDTEVRQNMAVLLQAYWQQVGVTLNIHASEWGTFSEVAMSNNANVYGMSWTWYPDPYFFLNKLFATDEWGGIGNGQHYSNAEVDDLLQKGLEATEQADRAAYYKQALSIITDDLPGLFYANENVIYGVNGRVHDFIQRADGTVKIVTPENNVWVTD
ncbi:MAG: ABC transporter substrate-binding protein [Coprococcus sp.]